ncbi:LrgA-associated membrane protein LrgB [Vibrio cholerae]|nr:LrgA-associated membrane protein LrgB [Vibrio cholerae]
MWLIITLGVFFVARWVAQKCNTPLANPLLISIGIHPTAHLPQSTF